MTLLKEGSMKTIEDFQRIAGELSALNGIEACVLEVGDLDPVPTLAIMIDLPEGYQVDKTPTAWTLLLPKPKGRQVHRMPYIQIPLSGTGTSGITRISREMSPASDIPPKTYILLDDFGGLT